MADKQSQIQELIYQLQHPIDTLPILLSLLVAPLDDLGILPPQFRKHNTNPLPPRTVLAQKHIPLIQRTLLEHVIPTWDSALAENVPQSSHLIKQYFCPDAFTNVRPVAGQIALTAYGTLLSRPLNQDGINYLQDLAKEYPIDRLWTAVFEHTNQKDVSNGLVWEDYVKDAISVPVKVANAAGVDKGLYVPQEVENGIYLNQVCRRVELLVERFAKAPMSDWTSSVGYLLTKLVNVGAFPPSPPTSRSQPSFWKSNLLEIRQQLHDSPKSNLYTTAWRKLIFNIPSSLTLRSIITSLFGSLSTIKTSTDSSNAARATVKKEAQLLYGILGEPYTIEDQQLWETTTSLMISRDWGEAYARIFVCWISMKAGNEEGSINTKALKVFLDLVVEAWSNTEHVKHSLISRHRYLSTLFLITASYFSYRTNELEGIVFSAQFIQGISTYISHLDTSVRRCGMLVAEIIAGMTNKNLEFGEWDGEDSGKPWCRNIRELVKEKDINADLGALDEPALPQEERKKHIPTTVEVISENADASRSNEKATFVTLEGGYDSDDSLTGYASPYSSRSVSPTRSELEEIEKDPTINVGQKKVARPVYLAQLGQLIRGPGAKPGAGDEPHEADKIEMALNCGEELIRKKKGYGTELDENAVNLAYGFLALHDNYGLPDFDKKRQGAMNALIAYSPKKASPALIEEFFKNQYSVDQRYVILNALALGARELASLPVPASQVPKENILFPSKMLPAPLHGKYLAASKDNGLLSLMVEDLSRKAIDRGKEATEDKVPEIVRERRFKIKKAPVITEVKTPSTSDTLARLRGSSMILEPKSTTFTGVAAEFFIGPLINRFWIFLRDEQTREERTSNREGRQKYHSAGTGLVLNPLIISQFLRTLAILVNASQNAPEWLAVLAPNALEVAVTIGTRPVSHMEIDDNEVHEDERERKEAAVLTASLELALIVLDGAIEIDDGKSLGLEQTTLLLGTGEWAGAVFARLEKGLRVAGGGGVNEAQLRRAAAGVLIKVDELTSRWRRSMLDTR